jgi:DNA-binding NtrC family response regulator
MGMRSREVDFGLDASESRLAFGTEVPVLIVGPTGTGKSTLARRIHGNSRKANGPFIEVNLASLHEQTIESALFGHEKGAFTGAERSRIGRLEAADGGTLFLDEIGELSLPLQARLLEFLQTKVFTPLGGEKIRKSHARVICATNRDLEEDVRAGRFREDLYYRIRVLRLELPPLREVVGEEFSRVVHGIVERFGKETGREIHRLDLEVARLLESYSWPGNYRELENVLELAILSGDGEVLSAEDLPRWFVNKAIDEKKGMNDRIRWERTTQEGRFKLFAEYEKGNQLGKLIEEVESAVLGLSIAMNRGNLAQAARDTGFPKATFYRKARSYGLLKGQMSPGVTEVAG